MADTRNYVAFDLGASSGRAIVGGFDGQRLVLHEVHRFENGPVESDGHLHWNVRGLFDEITAGLAKAVERFGADLAGVGIDTWGVDYGLLGADGQLLEDPFHYRDRRTDGILERAFTQVPRDEIYRQTGTQFMQFNTLFQLLACAEQQPDLLARAERLLFMPDLLGCWLAGRQVVERTIASTSQCLDPRTGEWATGLLERLGIPPGIFGEIVEPGTVLGPLADGLAETTGARGVRVIAPGCHDTASAVAAVPAESDDYAYLSSGTWSLMGVEIPRPVITERSLAYNFTNEGGVCGTIRFLKNISGLWLVQECRRVWAEAGEALSFDELTRMAADAPAFAAMVDPDAEDFIAPGDMPRTIAEHCRRKGQSAPESKGSIIRTALESLALKYRQTLDRLEEMLGRRVSTLHIVGGGTQNELLSQFAADATGRAVVTGPIEATALGNLLMQLLADGAIDSLAQGRALIRRSVQTKVYQPQADPRWAEAHERFVRHVEA